MHIYYALPSLLSVFELQLQGLIKEIHLKAQIAEHAG